MGGIIHCEVEGTPVLGFDTGLDAKAFAQTKSAQLMTRPGWIVSPDGKVELWRLEGVIEREGTMVIWGAEFAGERLDTLIGDNARRDEALDALRYWIKARIALKENQAVDHAPAPCPIGAFIDPQGIILFPPDQLIQRTIEREDPEVWRAGAVRWVHPDLTETEASLFASGTLTYRIFCGSPPFPNQDLDLLRQDLREGVFLPPRLAAPSLDSRLASLITGAIEPFTGTQQKKPSVKSPISDLETLRDYLGAPGSAKADSYFHSLSEEEQVKFTLEQERFRKKQGLTVKTKRFVVRNTTIIAVILVTIGIVGLIVRSTIKDRANMPTTKGMTPIEVVETYYGAIGNLDHTLMDACVIGKAGKEDINLVTNYFVISKVRQAYEMNAPRMLPAQQWIDLGAGPTETAIFGVSNLQVESLDTGERDGEASFKASYVLWLPESNPEMEAQSGSIPEGTANLPVSISRIDVLRLELHKNAWRITEIIR